MNLPEEIIVRPIITEKSMDDAAKAKFTFEVLKTASKKVIKKAVEEKFKVNIISVSTIIVKGKTRRQGKKRIEITKTPWKKAIVELKEGQKIDLFDTA